MNVSRVKSCNTRSTTPTPSWVREHILSVVFSHPRSTRHRSNRLCLAGHHRAHAGGTRVRESEERFRLVANNAPVMIWTSGLDKKPTYFNQLWLDFTGLSETDLRNGLAVIVHPEDYVQCHDVYCRGSISSNLFGKNVVCEDTMDSIAGCSTSECRGFTKTAPLLATRLLHRCHRAQARRIRSYQHEPKVG